MKIGRYAWSAVAIPAPDTPTANSSTGNQQQLDAMIAETTVPILAIHSPRLDKSLRRGSPFDDDVVAPGNLPRLLGQQSPAGMALRSLSTDIAYSFPCGKAATLATHVQSACLPCRILACE
jgi:hypothetical protein